MVWNFFINNYWTFRHRTLSGRKRVRGVKFNLVSLVTVGVSYTTFVLLTLAFPNGEPLVHQGLGIVPSVVLNYFLNSYWTFRDARE